MKSRISVVFDGAKFDYEVAVSKEEVLNELNSIRKEGGYLRFTDVLGRGVRLIPGKIPLIEVESLEDEE